MNLRAEDLGQRRVRRGKGSYVAWLHARGAEHPVRVMDASPLGAMVATDLALEAAEDVQFLGHGSGIPAQVVWVEGGRAGLEFTDPNRDRESIQALLRVVSTVPGGR